MSFKDTLKKNLTPEMFGTVCDALGDDFDFDMVPRSRLNKVIAQRNDLRKNVSKNTLNSIDDDDDDTKSTDDDGGTPKEITYTEKEVKKLLKAKDDEQNKAITSLKKQNVALEKLRANNAIDPEIILKSGLLNLDKCELGEDGTLSGIDDTIKSLIKDKAYFFKNSTSTHEQGTGKNSEGSNDNDDILDAKLSQIFGPDPSSKE